MTRRTVRALRLMFMVLHWIVGGFLVLAALLLFVPLTIYNSLAVLLGRIDAIVLHYHLWLLRQFPTGGPAEGGADGVATLVATSPHSPSIKT